MPENMVVKTTSFLAGPEIWFFGMEKVSLSWALLLRKNIQINRLTS